MYILPMLTHLEVVVLGARSDIFFARPALLAFELCAIYIYSYALDEGGCAGAASRSPHRETCLPAAKMDPLSARAGLIA